MSKAIKVGDSIDLGKTTMKSKSSLFGMSDIVHQTVEVLSINKGLVDGQEQETVVLQQNIVNDETGVVYPTISREVLRTDAEKVFAQLEEA